MRRWANPAAVMILTARSTPQDRIPGLGLGADDHIAKPFDVGEFEARVRSLLRRQAGLRWSVVTLGDLVLDLTARAFTAAQPGPAGTADPAGGQGGGQGIHRAIADRTG